MSQPEFPIFRFSGWCELKFVSLVKEVTVGIGSDAVRKITVYPNPASDFINIELPDYLSEVSLRVLNLLGQTMLVQDFSTDRLNISELSEGLYVLNITVGNKQYFSIFNKQAG